MQIVILKQVHYLYFCPFLSTECIQVTKLYANFKSHCNFNLIDNVNAYRKTTTDLNLMKPE